MINPRALTDLEAGQGGPGARRPAKCPDPHVLRARLDKPYGLAFSALESLDASGPLTKTALKTGKVQVGFVLTSDGSVSSRA